MEFTYQLTFDDLIRNSRVFTSLYDSDKLDSSDYKFIKKLIQETDYDEKDIIEGVINNIRRNKNSLKNDSDATEFIVWYIEKQYPISPDMVQKLLKIDYTLYKILLDNNYKFKSWFDYYILINNDLPEDELLNFMQKTPEINITNAYDLVDMIIWKKHYHKIFDYFVKSKRLTSLAKKDIKNIAHKCDSKFLKTIIEANWDYDIIPLMEHLIKEIASEHNKLELINMIAIKFSNENTKKIRWKQIDKLKKTLDNIKANILDPDDFQLLKNSLELIFSNM